MDISKIEKFDTERLGELLFVERTNARMTQEEVAARLGCGRRWVSRFERGMSGASIDLVVAYASMFGISLLMEIPERLPQFEGGHG